MIEVLKLNILIKPDGKKKVTDSGLIMANYSLEGGLRRGTVVSVGDKVRDVKVGDRVAYPVEEGKLVKYDDKEYYLMFETQIYGILEGETP
jgi:co-chaperonin GroES (HSP10)